MTMDRLARLPMGARTGIVAAFFFCLLALFILSRPAAGATTYYVYDELGRLVQATRSDGAVIQYRYDANGNLIGIDRHGASTLAIASFAPTITHATAAVVVNGSGFSEVSGENAVTVGGAPATVTAASATQLTITVPMAAQSGVVAVSVGTNTATSAQQIVIRRPSIQGFTPKLVEAGATITISGSHLNLMPGTTSFIAGGYPATITALSNTSASIVIPANASGRIRVQTAYGEATSADDLYVMPSNIAVSNVEVARTVMVGGQAADISVTQSSKRALLAFDAIAGQHLSIQFEQFETVPAGYTMPHTTFSPTGASLGGENIAADRRTIHLPEITTTGRHVLVMGYTGSRPAHMTARVEEDQIVVRGVNHAVTTNFPGQSKRLVLSANAGEDLSFAATNLVMTPASVNSVWVTVDQPGPGNLCDFRTRRTDIPGAGQLTTNIPVSGDHLIYIEPEGNAAIDLKFRVAEPFRALLIPDMPISLNLPVPGDAARLDFSATPGQTFAFNISSVVTIPANKSVKVQLFDSNDTELDSFYDNNSSMSLNFKTTAGGNYYLKISTQDWASLTANAVLGTGLVGEIPTDGTIVQYQATVGAQNGYFTFEGIAGQTLSFAKTGVTLSPASGSVGFTIRRPNGSQFNSSSGYRTDNPGSQITLLNLPDTGTYMVTADPTEHAVMGFKLRLSSPITGTLEVGAPAQPVNLPVQGDVAYYPFSATAGQTLAIHLGSIVTAPSGKAVWLEVYTASGTEVASVGGTASSKTLNLPNLTEGDYFVLVSPANASTMSGQIRMVNGAVADLPGDGTFVELVTEVPGQNAYLTFPATITQPMSLSSTNLTLTPTSGSTEFIVYRPSGSNWYSFTGSRSHIPGDQSNLLNFTQDGNYRIVADPSEQTIMSLRMRVAPMITGTLVPGAANVSLSLPTQGDAALLEFTIPTARSVSINLSSVVTAPAGETTRIGVYNASGSSVAANTGSSATRSLTINNLAAGTYRVIISLPEAGTATMQVRIP